VQFCLPGQVAEENATFQVSDTQDNLLTWPVPIAAATVAVAMRPEMWQVSKRLTAVNVLVGQQSIEIGRLVTE